MPRKRARTPQDRTGARGPVQVTPEEVKALVRESWSEAEFTDAVLALARRLGWRRAHFRPARTARGWRTAVSGDGAGFPDLLLCRRETLIVAELKVKRNKATPEQENWLASFRHAGHRAYVWYPEDWNEIERILEEGP